MNTYQTTIASLLALAIIGALPGIYMYTEGNKASQPGPRPSTNFEMVEADTVPEPESSELPETSFQLRRLSPRQKKQVEWKLAIDLNKATQKRLEALSGVGPATAKNIINYRKKHGGFKSIGELEDISGIGPATVEDLRSKVKIATSMSQRDVQTTSQSSRDEQEKIDINSAGKQELDKLPGIGPATADNIISYRDEHGRFRQVEDLRKVSGIGPATVGKLENRINF